MNASDWRWYGLRRMLGAKPGGSLSSTGYTCSHALRKRAADQRLRSASGTGRSRRGPWPEDEADGAEGLAAADGAAAGFAGVVPPLAFHAAPSARQWADLCVAMQWLLAHSRHSDAGLSHTKQ